MFLPPFTATSKTMSVAATATASASAALPGQGNQIRFVNEGPNIAFVSIGSAAQTATLPGATAGTATATSTPIPVGDTTLSLESGAVLNISLICRATQTAQVNMQVGEGL